MALCLQAWIRVALGRLESEGGQAYDMIQLLTFLPSGLKWRHAVSAITSGIVATLATLIRHYGLVKEVSTPFRPRLCGEVLGVRVVEGGLSLSVRGFMRVREVTCVGGQGCVMSCWRERAAPAHACRLPGQAHVTLVRKAKHGPLSPTHHMGVIANRTRAWW